MIDPLPRYFVSPDGDRVVVAEESIKYWHKWCILGSKPLEYIDDREWQKFDELDAARAEAFRRSNT